MNQRIILSAISALYLFCFSLLIVQWYLLSLSVVIDGDTREDMFYSILGGGPQWISTLNQTLFYCPIILSDGLLIWRCYHVWGQSYRVVTVPLIFFVGEVGLFLSTTIFAILHSQQSATEAITDVFNVIAGVSMLTSLCTTVITTFLIWYRIHSAFRSKSSPLSKKLFSHIVVLVIESAAVYSLILFLNAITTVVPSFTLIGSLAEEVNYYMQILLIISAGMSPTILVARVALTAPNDTVVSNVTRITGSKLELEFQKSSYYANSIGGDFSASIYSSYPLPTPVTDVKVSGADVTLTSGDYQV
ncbi:hypothetical protein CVT25_008902 [Psilocybe cyanescens]|uniref:THH1/TOM1/TOM3 domain-containing protein n=1 Tax=Psilocybe cyanescens TaxID=93625 RepID=A0A409XL43_PSICY|nr:hypothetical protein CVT25_008902 [Psilocybe cyanescens]